MLSLERHNDDRNSGVWIGIDLGTSNSSCAVWDCSRGSPKWMRLVDIAPMDGSKWGRLVPSVVKIPAVSSTSPLVGAQALAIPTGTLVSSVKRLLGRRLADLDPHWVDASLPYELTQDDQGELQIVIETSDTSETILMTPVQVLGSIMKGMRDSAQLYLKKYAIRKHLDVPGASEDYHIRNAVIGVPAHFSKRQILLVEQAARLAGLDGTINTCMESTAAAMAYGLTLQETSNEACIMVIDMGGGTSDVTIARKNLSSKNDDVVSSASSYQVLVTMGEERLGGDDIDQAMMEYCANKMQIPDYQSSQTKRVALSSLQRSCRRAKERICDLQSPSQSEKIWMQDEGRNGGFEVELDQKEFETILKPWLEKARSLIRRAMEAFDNISSDSKISEVILVGGTTRVPAIRNMIQSEFFPTIEIGSSLNPMSSVAQGLAIHAALLSQLVPVHQLRSALMLDCIPHAIGVLLGELQVEKVKNEQSQFIEILERNSPLPARGSTIFTLADTLQPGVTINAVEKITADTKGGETIFEPITKEPFTFLLHRLSKEQYAQISHRSIEVGMKVDTNGQFTISIFDEMDPEQVRKRQRFEKNGQVIGFHQADVRTVLGILWEDSNLSTEQFILIGLLVATVVMYIAVKIAFNEDLLVVPKA